MSTISSAARRAPINSLQRFTACLWMDSAMADVAHDRQLAARGYFQQVAHPGLDRDLTLVGPFAKLSASPAPAARRAPMLGEHTADVLQGVLGITDAILRALTSAGAIGPA